MFKYVPAVDLPLPSAISLSCHAFTSFLVIVLICSLTRAREKKARKLEEAFLYFTRVASDHSLVFSAIQFLKASSMVFLGESRHPSDRPIHECGKRMLAPMMALAVICVMIGFFPMLFWPLLSRVTATWHPAWAAEAAPAALWNVSQANITLAVLAGLAAVLLGKRCRHNGIRRALTWDCGFANPTPRMQYTSGSFSELLITWFRWILRPQESELRPDQMLPTKASMQQRIPDTVLECVLLPITRFVMRISAAVRSLQQGRLHAYILYLVAGLVALGLIVLTGGAR